MSTQLSYSVTVSNLTASQLLAIKTALADSADDGSEPEVVTKKSSKKTKPDNTVNEDEGEEFGTKPMTKKQLAAKRAAEAEEDDNSDDDTDVDADDGEEDEGESDDLSFDDVRAACSKYGEKHAAEMKEILHTFNFKNLKELSQHEKKWEPVYRRVMQRLAKLKKK